MFDREPFKCKVERGGENETVKHSFPTRCCFGEVNVSLNAKEGHGKTTSARICGEYVSFPKAFCELNFQLKV